MSDRTEGQKLLSELLHRVEFHSFLWGVAVGLALSGIIFALSEWNGGSTNIATVLICLTTLGLVLRWLLWQHSSLKG
jgi:hypothetical protein